MNSRFKENLKLLRTAFENKRKIEENLGVTIKPLYTIKNPKLLKRVLNSLEYPWIRLFIPYSFFLGFNKQKYDLLRKINTIRKKTEREGVIIFGSRAVGLETPKSDLDMLLLKGFTKEELKRGIKFSQYLHLLWALYRKYSIEKDYYFSQVLEDLDNAIKFSYHFLKFPEHHKHIFLPLNPFYLGEKAGFFKAQNMLENYIKFLESKNISLNKIIESYLRKYSKRFPNPTLRVNKISNYYYRIFLTKKNQ